MTIAQYKYAAWNGTKTTSFEALFNDENVQHYQSIIRELLKGVSSRPILVSLDTIKSVLWQCYESRNPLVGDPYSRYIQASNVNRTDLEDIVNRTINIIVSQIRNEYGMIENNKKLTKWTTVLGDFNAAGLRSHPPLKIRSKKPETMQFHMKY
jgi:hypothetical protein